MKFQDQLVRKLFVLIKDSEEFEAKNELEKFIDKFNILLLHSSLNLSEIFQLYMLEDPECVSIKYENDDKLIIKNKFDEVIVRSRSIELK